MTHRTTTAIVGIALGCITMVMPSMAAVMNKTGTQWAPFMEWSLTNSSFSGNPYDLVASATFNHQGSSASHKTEMFHVGNNTWKFRFTGTRTGTC